MDSIKELIMFLKLNEINFEIVLQKNQCLQWRYLQEIIQDNELPRHTYTWQKISQEYILDLGANKIKKVIQNLAKKILNEFSLENKEKLIVSSNCWYIEEIKQRSGLCYSEAELNNIFCKYK